MKKKKSVKKKPVTRQTKLLSQLISYLTSKLVIVKPPLRYIDWTILDDGQKLNTKHNPICKVAVYPKINKKGQTIFKKTRLGTKNESINHGS